MRKLLAVGLGIAIALVMSPVNSVTWAQAITLNPGMGAVQGIAKTAAGVIKPGTTVNLLNGAGETVGTTTANASGVFTFANINPGTFTLQLSEAGQTIGIAGNVVVTAGTITATSVTGVTAATLAAGIVVGSTTAAAAAAAAVVAGTIGAEVAAVAVVNATASPSR